MTGWPTSTTMACPHFGAATQDAQALHLGGQASPLAEGALWVGCYDTGEFLRVRDGGEVLDRIPVSPGWGVAPALGGLDGRTLYLVINETTIDGFLNGESVGRIEVAGVDVPAPVR